MAAAAQYPASGAYGLPFALPSGTQALPLPQLQPVPCVRLQGRTSDGHVIDQLHVPGLNRVFQMVRTIRGALMGKVKAAVECAPDPATGAWMVPAAEHRIFAVKQLYKICIARHCTTDGKPVREDPWTEIAVMAMLSDPGHANVLRLEALLEDEHCLYLVLEHCDGGELFDQVAALGHVREDITRHYIWQLINGLRYMHAKGVAHRDISLENAMLQSPPQPQAPSVQQQQQGQDGRRPLHQALGVGGGSGGSNSPTVSASTMSSTSSSSSTNVIDPAAVSSITPLIGGAAAAAAAAIAACTNCDDDAAMSDGDGYPAGAKQHAQGPIVKIIDFGLAVRLPSSGQQQQSNALTSGNGNGTAAAAASPSQPLLLLPENRVGKDRYMSPEINAMLPYDGVRADTWTVGMCIWYLLTGRELYQRADPAHCRVFAFMAQGRLRDILHTWKLTDGVSAEAIDLLVSLLQVDPWKRPTLEEVQQHPWFSLHGFGPPPPLAAKSVSSTSLDSSVSSSGPARGQQQQQPPGSPLQPLHALQPSAAVAGGASAASVAMRDLPRLGCHRVEGVAGGIVCTARPWLMPQQVAAAGPSHHGGS